MSSATCRQSLNQKNLRTTSDTKNIWILHILIFGEVLWMFLTKQLGKTLQWTIKKLELLKLIKSEKWKELIETSFWSCPSLISQSNSRAPSEILVSFKCLLMASHAQSLGLNPVKPEHWKSAAAVSKSDFSLLYFSPQLCKPACCIGRCNEFLMVVRLWISYPSLDQILTWPSCNFSFCLSLPFFFLVKLQYSHSPWDTPSLSLFPLNWQC